MPGELKDWLDLKDEQKKKAILDQDRIRKAGW